DAEEVVNDTWLRVWNSIPPNCPGSLAASTGRIARNLALNRYRDDHAACRDRDRVTPMEELTGTPEGEAAFLVKDPVAGEVEAAELSDAIAQFLSTLPAADRALFVRRYWRLDGLDTLANEMHMTPGHVRVKLHRIREKLKKYLEGRGLL
ncbi:MAG: sigma-70 family RNA polymerase sigma factor, partial [Clostridia bacterium]|nr:sigma-70 family RNA polymerase sigma factor [Clostridia bacterium]